MKFSLHRKKQLLVLFFWVLLFLQSDASAWIVDQSAKAFYFKDATNELTIKELDQMRFAPITDYNFGFNTQRVWVKIPMTDEIRRHAYLQVGKYNTYPVILYGIRADGSHEVLKRMSFKRRDAYEINALTQFESLIVKTVMTHVPTLLPVRIIHDISGLLQVDEGENYTFYIVTILLSLVGLASLASFFVTRQFIFLIYFFHLLFTLGWVAFDAGVTKMFFSNSGIFLWAYICLVLIFYVCLPLILLLKISRSYKMICLRVLVPVMAINVIFVGLGFEIIGFLAIQIVIVISALIFLTLYHYNSIKGPYRRLFVLAYLVILVVPVGKLLLMMGLVPDTFFFRMSDELGLTLQAVLWGVFIVLNNIDALRSRIILEESIAELEKKAKYSLLEGQEAERNWFGKELHDNIGSTLSAIRLLIQTNPEASHQYLKSINEELVQLSSRYQNPISSKVTLVESIKRHVNVINQSDDVKVSFECDEDKVEELLDADKLNIYRVIQELLTNAIRHGNANRIILQILYSDAGNLIVYVEDNGKGFPDRYEEGLGFTNIRSRLNHRLIDLNISSQVGIGAQVQLTLSV